MEEPIPVAVVGAGNMGANHARVYDELPGADLVEVVEPDPGRAAEIGARYDVAVRGSVDELTLAEAATVAVPNHHHRDVAESCIGAGLDVLVEKPLATTVEDAVSIVERATDHDRVLSVGHIERFNPVVETLGRILDQEDVIALESHRLGPFSQHLTDESVVFDLMIHDIDVMLSLVDDSPSYVDAVGARSRSDDVDHAVAQFKFDDEVLATAVASHVTHGKVRELTATTTDAYVTLNYQSQDITIQRRGVEQTTTLGEESGYRTETITESPYVRTREPLKNELEDFLARVRDRGEPRVSGRDGVRAVRLASEVVGLIRSH